MTGKMSSESAEGRGDIREETMSLLLNTKKKGVARRPLPRDSTSTKKEFQRRDLSMSHCTGKPLQKVSQKK